jgi:hypothetical protein
MKQTKASPPVVKVHSTYAIEYLIPKVPASILQLDGKGRPIYMFTDEQLAEIGAAWTRALQTKARSMRSEATAKLNKTLAQERQAREVSIVGDRNYD